MRDRQTKHIDPGRQDFKGTTSDIKALRLHLVGTATRCRSEGLGTKNKAKINRSSRYFSRIAFSLPVAVLLNLYA